MPEQQSLKQLAFKPTPAGHPLLEVQRIDAAHPLHSMPPHTHHFLEFLYFDQPGGTHRVGANTEKIKTGSVFVIAPGELHDARNIGRAQGWLVMFTPETLGPRGSEPNGFFDWLSHPLLVPFMRSASVKSEHWQIATAQRERWSALLGELERELRDNHFGFQEAASALLRLMLVELSRLVDPKIRETLPLQSEFLKRVFAFIETHHTQTFRMSDLAEQVHRSPNHVTSVVKNLTGRSVRDWLLERRMAGARALLMAGGLDVSGIAEEVGYNDVTQFIRQFKRLHGLTPLAWRKANR